MTTLPTGAQYAIAHGGHTAVVTEVGATLRTYEVAGRAVLDGFAQDEQVVGARGMSLLPWPNRVADGRWSWRGQELQLALTEPDRQCAIHGLTRWAPWRLVEHTPSSVRLQHLLPPQTGWPFTLLCELGYALTQEGLTVSTTVTNVGAQPSPFATGAHPYLSAGGGLVDECEVQVGATSWLPTDARGIPTGVRTVEGSDRDLRRATAFGTRVIDEAYTDLDRDADGRARVVVTRPDGTAVQLWAGPEYPYLEVFSGDTLPVGLRRRGLGVEPMTAPPNALQTGQDLIVLAPGQTRTFRWGIGPLSGGAQLGR